uniref:Uncharacterized protein n=1 Tax=Triticum urartu TaxID=4572 RepID=A0A8R7TDP6_TRIUA
MPGEMDDPRVAVDGGRDPRVGVVLVVAGVLVAGPQAERAHGRRRVAQEEEAVHEVAELLRRVGVAAGGVAHAEVDAGRGSPEVAPPPREHAGADRLPRLERRHDVVQERVREGAEAVGLEAGAAARPRALGGAPAHFVKQKT